MPRIVAKQSEKDLRRAVLRLKSLAPSDFDAVLQELDDDQKRRTLDLLQAMQPAEPDEDSAIWAESSLDVLAPEGVSPWLLARVNGVGDTGEETADRFSLTGHAQARLRACSAAMVPEKDRKRKAPSLLDRLWSQFS